MEGVAAEEHPAGQKENETHELVERGRIVRFVDELEALFAVVGCDLAVKHLVCALERLRERDGMFCVWFRAYGFAARIVCFVRYISLDETAAVFGEFLLAVFCGCERLIGFLDYRAVVSLCSLLFKGSSRAGCAEIGERIIFQAVLFSRKENKEQLLREDIFRHMWGVSSADRSAKGIEKLLYIESVSSEEGFVRLAVSQRSVFIEEEAGVFFGGGDLFQKSLFLRTAVNVSCSAEGALFLSKQGWFPAFVLFAVANWTFGADDTRTLCCVFCSNLVDCGHGSVFEETIDNFAELVEEEAQKENTHVYFDLFVFVFLRWRAGEKRCFAGSERLLSECGDRLLRFVSSGESALHSVATRRRVFSLTRPEGFIGCPDNS
ncbi:MAG: uncharacterized protein A8A55_2761 [Amphiamblys sp. WSBS2006]|nr:MAG: uncharacterized protein A8A55_2761 [Amphiamblys sp. WSBS2006]